MLSEKRKINTYVPSDTRNVKKRRNYRDQHYMTAWLLREKPRAAGKERSCRERSFLYAVTKTKVLKLTVVGLACSCEYII